MRSLTDGGVVHMKITPDCPHNYLAGVKPHADLHIRTVSAPRVIGVTLHRFLHPKRGIAGAYRVIFMRDWRPEERHDAIAHHLVYGPFVVVDGLNHQFENGIKSLSRVFGVPVGQELHRAFEVGKQDRDLLTFTFERAFGEKNFLSEML